jgi:hypothetical protein
MLWPLCLAELTQVPVTWMRLAWGQVYQVDFKLFNGLIISFPPERLCSPYAN